MNLFSILPYEANVGIFSLLPKQDAKALSETCKSLYNTYASFQFDIRAQNPEALSAYVCRCINHNCSIALNILFNRVGKNSQYPDLYLCICSLKNELPLLKKMKETSLQVIELQVSDASEDKEVMELASLFENLETSSFKKLRTVYFLDCSKFSSKLVDVQYPPSVDKIFLRNVTFTQEILQRLAKCEHLRKLVIQPAAHSSLPREELLKVQSSQPLEITVLEDKTMDYLVLYEPPLYNSPSIESFRRFWNGTSGTRCMSPAEKLHFLFLFLSNGPHHLPWLRQELETQVMNDLQQAISANPHHVLSLVCLGTLQFFLSPEEKVSSAENLLSRALDIEPDNVFAKVVLTCICDKKSQTDSQYKERVSSLMKGMSNQLIDSTSKAILLNWVRRNPGYGSLLVQEEADYANSISLGLRMRLGAVFKTEYMNFNIQFLCCLAAEKANLLKSLIKEEDKAEREHLEEIFHVSNEEYYKYQELCISHYPRYAPFFFSLDAEETTWEKSFHPEELLILQQLKKQFWIDILSGSKEL